MSDDSSETDDGPARPIGAAAPGSAPVLSVDWTVLARSGWLSRRDPRIRDLLFPLAVTKTFDAGRYLYRAGDEADGVYGLVSGALDASIPRIDGQELIFHRADPGFWVGDLALFSRNERLVSLRAAATTRVVHLPQAKLHELTRREPEVIIDFYQLSHENFATTLRLLGNLSIPGAEKRLAFRLLVQEGMSHRPGQWIEMSQDKLAEITALSPVSTHRAIRQLESRGLIETGYGRIRIRDRNGLVALCGSDPGGRRGAD